jgi:DNA-binding transcriptional ArsR family regulator
VSDRASPPAGEEDALPEVAELDDPRAIRAIAHPARLVVIDALYDRGLALTATQAAAMAGTTPSAMSYHLRALERYGLVRRAPATDDGRERPWVRVAKDLRIRPPAAGRARAMALATNALVATAMDVTRDRLLVALERAHDETRRTPLDKAATFGTAMVRATAEETTELLDQMRALVEPFRDEVRRDAPEDAGLISIVIASIPDPDEPGRPDPDGRQTDPGPHHDRAAHHERS